MNKKKIRLGYYKESCNSNFASPKKWYNKKLLEYGDKVLFYGGISTMIILLIYWWISFVKYFPEIIF